MILSTELEMYIDGLLQCSNFKDYAPNGLQIEGEASIHTICTAVTASLEVIQKACTLNAQALLVHHGYFWRGEPANIRGIKKNRISQILKQNMNLYAYHLPLDCHPELGNNACLAQILGLTAIESHSLNNTPHLFWTGALETPRTTEELILHIQATLGYTPIHIPGKNALIQRLAWCSGAAQDFIHTAYQFKADAYLSGEISERTYYEAKELGIDYFACGHHATERFGIQALGEHLAHRFQLTHYFIDSDNPI